MIKVNKLHLRNLDINIQSVQTRYNVSMETIWKTESKIGKNDEPSHIPMQMPRP